jgi:hypothetical protein
MKYKIGNTPFEAKNLAEAIAYVKEGNLTGKLVKVSSDTTIVPDGERTVTVTCVSWTLHEGSWIRSDHKWSGTIKEVSGQPCCPQHRK